MCDVRVDPGSNHLVQTPHRHKIGQAFFLYIQIKCLELAWESLAVGRTGDVGLIVFVLIYFSKACINLLFEEELCLSYLDLFRLNFCLHQSLGGACDSS